VQADSGAICRVRFALNEFMAEYEMDESYVQATSRQMFETRLENLNHEQLGDVIAALKIHLGRHTVAAASDDNEPF